MAQATNCEKLKILLWKNLLIERAHKGRIVCYYILPLFFVLLLHFTRTIKEPETQPELIFKPVNISNLNLLKNIWTYSNLMNLGGEQPIAFELLYSPKNSFIDMIMEEVVDMLDLDGCEGYTSAYDLEKALMNSNLLAGVEFDERLTYVTDVPKQLKYALRFPNELRTLYGSKTLQTWHTKELHPKDMGQRNMRDDDGGSPDGYIREGFIALQNAVAMAYLKVAGNSSSFPLIQMQRFPYPPHTEDPVGQITYHLYFSFLILTFLIPCVKITAFVTDERQTRLKEVMKIMGLQNWLHSLAWFLKSFIVLATMSVLIVFVLKVQLGSSVAVLNESSALVLYLFYLTYIMAAISFAMLVSVWFNRVNTAVIALVIIWFASISPMYFDKDESSLYWKLAACLSFNSAFGFGNHIVVLYEQDGEGLHWDNLFTPHPRNDTLSVGLVMVMLLVATVLYMLIAMYIEQVAPGEYGTPKVWNFFCKIPTKAAESFDPSNDIDFIDEYFLASSSQMYSTQSFSRIRHSQDDSVFEMEPNDKQIGIQLQRLTKVYGGKAVVKELTMNMYKDEITVLLGHNGAGKTTTVAMLSGMLSPTMGTAVVNGWDIKKNIDQVRQSLSICPQFNTLFEDMSVRNHIEFFSRLRGLRGSSLTAEIDKYLKVTGLKKKQHNTASTLSGGMKRNLSVCCALCGNVAVVLFDEPSSGLDTGSRRQLWDILQTEKTGRTFLLTTHYMDEAEVLGDRIAIMNDGQLKCYGTSFFLKKKFGTGYQLICEKGENCVASAVTSLLGEFIPFISVKTETNTELSYTLHDSYSPVFVEMFTALENQLQELNLKGFGVTASSLEEIFMTVGADQTRESRISHEIDRSSITLDAQQSYIFNTVNGFVLHYNHWRAMLMKAMLYTLRRFTLYALQILMIMMVLFVLYNDLEIVKPLDKISSMLINLKQYKKAVTVLEVDPSIGPDSIESLIATEYEEVVTSYGPFYTFQVTGSKDFSSFIMSKGTSMKDQSYVTKNYMVAATIAKNKIICWFNNWGYHTAPLSLNLIHNALARAMIGEAAEIVVANAPLPFKPQSVIRVQEESSTLGKEFASLFSVVMCFVISYFMIAVIKERQCNFKLLQLIGGLGEFTYWFSRYAWDLITYVIMVIITLTILYFFKVEDFSTMKQFSQYFVVLLVFGLSFLPFIYVMSFLFSEPFEGYINMSIINIIIIIILIIMDFLKDLKMEGKLVDFINYVGPTFPIYSLHSALENLCKNYEVRQACSRSLLTPNFKCEVTPECCAIKGFYDWKEPGMLKYLVYLVLVGVFCFVLLFLFEFFLLEAIRRLFQMPRSRTYPQKNLYQDEDVKAEEDFVKNMESKDREKYNLVVDKLSKYFGKYLAVNQISLCIKSFDCFGLLGMNGAGKTTTFRMIVGDLAPSAGHIYMQGEQFQYNKRYVYNIIGYCPQNDSLADELTARETLHMFLLISGVHERLANEKAEDLAAMFGFQRYLDKPVKALSGGTKRKLSMAVAIVGNPSQVFLDEPSNGMDPASRRQIRSILTRLRDGGKSIVLTTHSMDDIEAICTRLTIMVNGELRCMGSVQHLKSKFSKGLILKIKLKRINDTIDPHASIRSFNEPPKVSSAELVYNINALKAFMQQEMPDADLQDEYRFLITYTIPVGAMKYSEIFMLLENNRSALKIEDYYISQTSLEEVFLQFAKYQRRSDRYSIQRAKSLTNVTG